MNCKHGTGDQGDRGTGDGRRGLAGRCHGGTRLSIDAQRLWLQGDGETANVLRTVGRTTIKRKPTTVLGSARRSDMASVRGGSSAVLSSADVMAR